MDYKQVEKLPVIIEDVKPGEIVFQGKSKTRKDVLIRYIKREDTQAACDYINTISKEETFISFQGEQLTLEEEEKYFAEQLKKIEKKQTVHLLAFCDNVLVGISEVSLQERVNKHVGTFGLSIAKDYRGEGIGKLLMQAVLEEAEKTLPDLHIIMLTVFGSNNLAYEMYKKFGFVEHGNLPKSILHKGSMIDYIYMHKRIK